MEDVLEVYARPYDPQRPVVCLDEKPYQLLDHPNEPIPASPGNVQKIDSQYERCGTCSIFMLTEPLSGWRHTEALPQRTMKDWAGIIKHLVDDEYPDAEKIVLVEDNLNTHTLASLYSTYVPEEALRIAKKLEMHFTPKHGSWLDIAEIELSALSTQCLGKRRISTINELNKELSAWEHTRNSAQKGVDWHFTTSDARIKLKSLYPLINF
jgi:hypothetical protein